MKFMYQSVLLSQKAGIHFFTFLYSSFDLTGGLEGPQIYPRAINQQWLFQPGVCRPGLDRRGGASGDQTVGV